MVADGPEIGNALAPLERMRAIASTLAKRAG
jgi:hypothetical protein